MRARALRRPVTLVRIEPNGGAWPAQRSLLPLEWPTADVTAFRSDRTGHSLVLNDLSGSPSHGRYAGRDIDLPPFGVRSLPL